MFPKDAQAAVAALATGPEHAEQDEHNTNRDPDAPYKGRHEDRLPPPDRRVGLSCRLFDGTRTGLGHAGRVLSAPLLSGARRFR